MQPWERATESWLIGYALLNFKTAVGGLHARRDCIGMSHPYASGLDLSRAPPKADKKSSLISSFALPALSTARAAPATPSTIGAPLAAAPAIARPAYSFKLSSKRWHHRIDAQCTVLTFRDWALVYHCSRRVPFNAYACWRVCILTYVYVKI